MKRDFGPYYDRLRTKVNKHLAVILRAGEPKDLREACRYVLTSGGKRLRAVLVMISSEATGGSATKALPAAAAIEIMHNFTLVHDDIMDHAESRRGAPTVHVRWDLNTALLGGDTLLAIAYKELLKTSFDDLRLLVSLFTRGVYDVCEGQALDLAYEKRNDVTVPEYFAMIARKTGSLISTSTEVGALIGGGKLQAVRAMRSFGEHLGRAFQLQDDLLDVIGDEKQFGKTIGGDIIEGKRTYMLLRALERSRGSDRKLLKEVMRRKSSSAPALSPAGRHRLVRQVRTIYETLGVIDATQRLVAAHTQRALKALDGVPPSRARDMLRWLSLSLVHRAS